MKSPALSLTAISAVLALATGLPALAAEKTVVKTLTQELAAGDAPELSVNVPVGSLMVTGGGGDNVKVSFDIKCEAPESSQCRKVVEDLRVEFQRSGAGIELKLEGWPKLRAGGIEVSGRVEVPRRLAIEAGVGVGDVKVSGVQANVEVDVGVGQVQVTIDEDDIASTNIDCGVGDASLTVRGSKIEGSGFVGRGLEWKNGKGKAHVEIDVGVGDADVIVE